jgi:hypothetical protein
MMNIEAIGALIALGLAPSIGNPGQAALAASPA